MYEAIYEFTSVTQRTDREESPSVRLGFAVVPIKVEVDRPAVLVHADNWDMAVMTTHVRSVAEDGDMLTFSTDFTTYVLERRRQPSPL